MFFKNELNDIMQSYIMKTTWKIINGEVENKANEYLNNLNLSHNGQTNGDPVVVTNVFNDYFINSAGKDSISKGNFNNAAINGYLSQPALKIVNNFIC
jgi:formylmethanofuran dehydrogenase subunit D